MDWVAASCFKENANLLCSGFRDYLNLNDLEDTGQFYVDRIGPCKIVKNKRTGIIFNHDFPQGSALAVSYPMVRAKYKRRIQRVMREILKSHRVLFIYMEENSQTQPLQNLSVVSKASDLLSKNFPNQEVHLLYLSNDIRMKKGIVKRNILSPLACHIVLNYKNEKQEDAWVPDWKALEKAIGYLRIRKPIAELLCEKLLLTFSYLIIFRSMRRKFLRKCRFYI